MSAPAAQPHDSRVRLGGPAAAALLLAGLVTGCGQPSGDALCDEIDELIDARQALSFEDDPAGQYEQLAEHYRSVAHNLEGDRPPRDVLALARLYQDGATVIEGADPADVEEFAELRTDSPALRELDAAMRRGPLGLSEAAWAQVEQRCDASVDDPA